MNSVQGIRQYVDKMIQNSGPGMKILLMDLKTTAVVSSVYAQSEIMQKEVYLCDRLDNFKNRDPLRHLKCLTFLRPTDENIHLLCTELRMPLYGQYFLHWTNIISKADVKRLAEADEHEVVREINEFFADYIPINPHSFITNIPHGPIFSEVDLMDDKTAHSVGMALMSFLLSVKKAPLIRYTDWSLPCQKLADKIQNLMNKESNLFEFPQRQGKPVLLILDRRDDCVTPLLNQWTYQAMVHELLTIKNHRVNLANAPDAILRQSIGLPTFTMFTWAKELLSPSLQTGKPVNASGSRRKSQHEDGEMTEEGFVCVGKSSFYTSPEMPAPMHSQVMNNQQSPIQMCNNPTTLYPALSHHQAYNPNYLCDTSDHNEFVRRIPFTLRSGLISGVGGCYRQQRPLETYLTQSRTHFREKYDYDFHLEKGVIRENSH